MGADRGGSPGLDISMLDRLLSMGMEVQFLSEQYRMHPQIAPGNVFFLVKGLK